MPQEDVMKQTGAPLLSVRNLTIEFGRHQRLRAVNGVSFDVSAGETLAIVGESGSGKTVSAMSILGLTPGHIVDGSIVFEGRDLVHLPAAEMRLIRGGRIGIVFQDPMSSLNPVQTIFQQISEMIAIHRPDKSTAEIRSNVIDLLKAVGIPDAENCIRRYPHEYSGGMRQRAMIAIAMANSPRLLIADEPTTALDVTIQAQVLRVLKEMQQAVGAGMILISHDLALVSQVSDRVAVMYAGRIVETADTASIFRSPRHPYTRSLLASLPDVGAGRRPIRAIPGQAPSLAKLPLGCAFHPRCSEAQDRPCCRETRPELNTLTDGAGADHRVACHLTGNGDTGHWKKTDDAAGAGRLSPMTDVPAGVKGSPDRLHVEHLSVSYISSGGFWRARNEFKAVDDVTLMLRSGETLALVGETGSGKSTTARAIMGLLKPTSGRVLLDGRDIAALSRKQLRPIRQSIQMVFQDAYASLNPRMTAAAIISEPIRLNGLLSGLELQDRVADLMRRVGLRPEHATRLPHEFSGGQRQRIAIARALSLNPEVLILDEPTSALDVSIQAQVINLLSALQRDLGLSYLFISHDLGLVRQFAHRVAVMCQGRIVEEGSSFDVFGHPRHAYTKELIAAAPRVVLHHRQDEMQPA